MDNIKIEKNKLNQLIFNLKYNKIKENEKISKRNYGIDLLRILSMINIINLHFNSCSNLLLLKPNSFKFEGVWLSEIFSYCAVNCFGLISGIVGYRNYNFSNLIYLWTLLFFYSVIFSTYLYVKNIITKKDLILSFFPVLNIMQWYFNAYFSMYLFLPFINEGIKNLNRKIYRNIVFFFILFFSFYYIIATIFSKNNYNFLNNGYSSLWLIILYIIGGYLGKYLSQSKNYFRYNFIYFLIYIISSFFTSEIKFKLVRMKNKYSEILINYISPTILLQAISLVIFFSSLDIKNKILKKIITFFTPLTFGILPIHWFFFKQINIMTGIFKWINSIKGNMFFFKLYALGIMFYFIAMLFSYRTYF